MDYPEREWEYYLFAKRFGWSPQVVDEQPAALAAWLLAIDDVVKAVENDYDKRADGNKVPKQHF